MKRNSLLIAFIFYAFISFSQKNFGSPLRIFEKSSEINSLEELNENWDVQLRSFAPSANRGPISESELTKARNEARDIKNDKQQSVRQSNVSPNLAMGFESNRSNGSVPPDNAIAVSNNGHVISCVNSNIWIGRADGKVDKSTGLSDFFKKVQLGGSYFDPRVVFDHKFKRFIVVCLVGSTPSTSYVVLAASKAEDPNLGFNFYKIKGDLEGDGVWFDYPNVGMTNDELFINGNMFTPDPNVFKYSTIFQIDKKTMFDGQTMKMKSYPRLTNPTGGIIFNCTPTMPIDSASNSNVAHFLSARTSGNNFITYCKIVGNLNENPSYEAVKNIEAPQYQVAPLANMKNNNDKLRTNDCRIQHCLKSGNIIHFALTSRVDTLAGLYIGRLDLTNDQVYAYKFSEPDLYSAYPGIAYLGKVAGEETFLIHYLRSSEEVFPEMAGIMVGGSRDEFIVSPSQLIRVGETAITSLTGDERWGDYTTACTRLNPQGETEVWINGCYGRPGFASYTAQFLQPEAVSIDFFPNKSVGIPGDTILLSHVSTDNLTEIEYDVIGGRKLGDVQATGFILDSLGIYSGIMKAKNDKGQMIVINKKNIISIQPKITAPVTDFAAEKVVIFAGDSIQFFDLSVNQPKEWKWSFSGGEPEKSDKENPKVIYPEKGAYNVLLNAGNDAGSQTKFKPRFITVKERPSAPIINFSSDKKLAAINDTIAFFDLSENNPFSWKWQFIGEKDTLYSDVKNPKMTFAQVGKYAVNLMAANDGGASDLTRKDFITITTTVKVKEEIIQQSVLYPNPSSDRISLTFLSPVTQNLKYEIYDLQGKLVKMLLEKNTKIGENELSFSTDPMTNGNYVLRVVSLDNFITQSFNFIVQK